MFDSASKSKTHTLHTSAERVENKLRVCRCEASSSSFFSQVTTEKLFSNLSSILAAHQRFWQEVMRPMLQMARQTGRPFDPLMLEPGCLQFQERFPSYFQYCLEEEKAVDFTRRQMESNPHFNAFLTWVETHPQCSRMRLGDMQAKPHQRITKYPLLLKAILKTTEDPETQDSLKRMLSSINNFVDNIDNHLKQRHEELALFQCAQRIEGFDMMEGMSEEIDKHVREFCQFDLMSPVRGADPEVIRKLLLEDTVKIRGRKDSRVGYSRHVLCEASTHYITSYKVKEKKELYSFFECPVNHIVQ
ncbi:pleckstrin homology domain-containing family G member 6-like isoform X1 [Clupea harengus]|uniref:Pleckstrin homology domain-containing family G member 6-like isoform X1 n=1 Tax=Clupea harengus TaxID=7950 RepID=A0A8M1KQZ5_CLUHA|nr:pleckstrin homology domain-containing family G member 6-like isoform X1 [Clupea harengus]